jgi:ferredoxin
MPTLTVEGRGTFEVAEGTRLVRAIEDNGTPILHRCGGNARCTTCRIEFIEGEPNRMTEAEFNKLTERGLIGQVRLSCQSLCTHDMTVRPLMTMDNQDVSDPGPTPEPYITPEPVWGPWPR